MSVRIVHGEAGIEAAAERLRNGALVAFPTETVYGLGAHALDPDAVERIFAAKGRPASNPVIVHVADSDAARALAKVWPDAAQRLAEAFWPGPLTLVVEKTDQVPDIVTAGGATVGLRVPAHPVALALLRKAAVPVAAPSANRSEELSPTDAAQVAEALGGSVEELLIVDGGPCAVGVESTVVDATVEPVRILRPGMVTATQVRSVLGAVAEGSVGGGPARSPGQRTRHYAPRKPVILCDAAPTPGPGDASLALGDEPATAARRLYAELRKLDADLTVRRILVALPPDTPEWAAIRDRLRRASAAS